MVRPAGRDDAEVIATMLHQFNLEFGEPSPGEAFLETRVLELISSGAKSFLLALPGSVDDPETGAGYREPGDPAEAAGLAQVDFRPSVWSQGPVALLEELYVVPERRGRGLGRELMGAVLALARERAAHMVEVITGEDDTAARGLYESTGFTNRIEGEDRTSALYYELEL